MERGFSEEGQWCGKVECRLCGLRARALFAGLSEAALETIGDAIEECRLPAGESIYRGGEPGDALFTVRSGLVKLVQYLPGGGRRIVRLALPGDVLGLEALLGETYQHDAVVAFESRVCRLPAALIQRLSGADPRLHGELLRRWQRALSEADAWLTELSTGPARQRVARLLLRLSDSSGEGCCPLFGREDMAAMLAITTETASRTVAGLKRAGLLVDGRGARSFRCDRAALERIAAD